jgi:hypothetical protein
MRTNKKGRPSSLRHYLAIVLLSFALLVIPFGCAHIPKTATPSSEQKELDLGTIGIVTASFPPEVKLQKPMGKAGGAGAGALVGAAAAGGTVLYVVAYTGPVGILLLAYPPVTAVAAGITGAGALIGGVVGAVKGESSRKIKETKNTLNEALPEYNIQEKIVEEFLNIAHERTRHHFISLGHKGPATPDEKVNYHFLVNEGIDTALEISPLMFGLVRKEININPPLSFQMKIRARVVRVVDSTELYAHAFKYESAHKKFIDWSADNGQPFKEEFNQGIQNLASDIVDDIFLKYFPTRSGQNNSSESIHNDSIPVEKTNTPAWE